MAEIGHITATLTEEDNLTATTIGSSLEHLTAGLGLGNMGLWTRAGFDAAMEDIDRLQIAVSEMRIVLIEEKRTIGDLGTQTSEEAAE